MLLSTGRFECSAIVHRPIQYFCQSLQQVFLISPPPYDLIPDRFFSQPIWLRPLGYGWFEVMLSQANSPIFYYYLWVAI